MQKSSFENRAVLDYIENEIVDLHLELSVVLGREYSKIYNAEAEEYRSSLEYKKAQNKAYWSRPKEERDREALEDELAKLDYWVPRRGTSDKHITYLKAATNSCSSPVSLVGFAPSVSKAMHYRRAAKKIAKKVNDPVLLSVFESLRIEESFWVKPKNFDAQLQSNLLSVGEQQYLEEFRANIMYIYDIFNINLSNKSRKKTRYVITNGCKINAMVLEQKKTISLSIDICKFNGQLHLLGLHVGDRFKLKGIPFTYQIEAIFR